MAVSQNLKRLIEANAPLWAGEAEIIRTYWTSRVRNREADKLWLKRQCWKEYAGVGDSIGTTKGMVGDLEVRLRDLVPRLDIDVDRHDLRELLEKVYVEYTHYCLFADIYDSLREKDEPKLNANELATWPEEEALASLRRDMRKNLGKLGMRASNFTEGGYCTMYSEGAKLKGRSGLDGRIGRACQKVYNDEFGHMMSGVVGASERPRMGGDDRSHDAAAAAPPHYAQCGVQPPGAGLADQGDPRRQDRAGRVRLREGRGLPEIRPRGGGRIGSEIGRHIALGALHDRAPQWGQAGVAVDRLHPHREPFRVVDVGGPGFRPLRLVERAGIGQTLHRLMHAGGDVGGMDDPVHRPRIGAERR
jgi:hypothetical protein